MVGFVFVRYIDVEEKERNGFAEKFKDADLKTLVNEDSCQT